MSKRSRCVCDCVCMCVFFFFFFFCSMYIPNILPSLSNSFKDPSSKPSMSAQCLKSVDTSNGIRYCAASPSRSAMNSVSASHHFCSYHSGGSVFFFFIFWSLADAVCVFGFSDYGKSAVDKYFILYPKCDYNLTEKEK